MNNFSTMADDHLAWYRHSLAAGELPAPTTGTIIALIAEVERLRKKCDDLTVDGFQAKLKQLDEAKNEVRRLKEVVAGYCGSGQRIQDLSDDCGLLEESDKAMRAEIERLRALLRAACADPESQPSLEAWAKIRREFGPSATSPEVGS